MEYYIAASSRIGIGKTTNQDGYAVLTADTDHGPIIFSILCDGMGGLHEGELASLSLVNAFTDWFQNSAKEFLESVVESRRLRLQWEMVMDSVNKELLAYGKDREIQLGTTLALLLLTTSHYYAMNVGDSRVYRIREGLHQITEDHSLVQREVSLGNITKEEARCDSRRNILLQGVGVTENLRPNYYAGPMKENSVFLLCSDGFYGVLSEEELLHYFQPDAVTTGQELNKLTEQLTKLVQDRGETDDISLVAIKVYGHPVLFSLE